MGRLQIGIKIRRASESNQVMTYRTGFEVGTPARTAVVVGEGTAGAGCPEGVVHRPRTWPETRAN